MREILEQLAKKSIAQALEAAGYKNVQVKWTGDNVAEAEKAINELHVADIEKLSQAMQLIEEVRSEL